MDADELEGIEAGLHLHMQEEEEMECGIIACLTAAVEEEEEDDLPSRMYWVIDR